MKRSLLIFLPIAGFVYWRQRRFEREIVEDLSHWAARQTEENLKWSRQTNETLNTWLDNAVEDINKAFCGS